jgi:CheY-like chemotaxis protein
MGIDTLNFLLIDDDEIFNFLNMKSVTKSEHCNKVETFSSSIDALDSLLSLIALKKEFPDIILLDISMPVMNGFDFLEAYERIPLQYRNSTFVFMLSSSMNDEDISKAMAFESVLGYIAKPLNSLKVENICNKVLSKKKIRNLNFNTKEISNEIYTIPLEAKTGLAKL